MKLTKIFLTLQYVCLAGTTAIPLIIASEISNEVKSIMPGFAKALLLGLIFLVIIATLVIEIVCTKKAYASIKKGDSITAVKTWELLKLVSIPFYVINFVIYIASAPVSFPLCLITIPLDFLFCWIMIIISGVLGIKTVKMVKTEKMKINPVFNVFQLLPIFDVFSTISVKNKLKNK